MICKNIEEKIEIWKPVKGYIGIYEVSSFGRVKRIEKIKKKKPFGYICKKEKILKQSNNKDGYKIVRLTNGDKFETVSVHRLVAMAFLKKIHGYNQINHKDENKSNNCVENLEWCTRKYNCNYGTRNERISKKNKENRSKSVFNKKGGSNPNAKKVYCGGITFDCIKHCAEHYGVKQWVLGDILLGKRKIPKEFIDLGLKYIDN